MTEEKIWELFKNTNIGKQTIKRLYELKTQNDQLNEKVIFLSQRIHELEDKLNNSDIQYQTKYDENAARNLMEDCISAYKLQQPNRYVFSMVDDNDKEIRVYSKHFEELLK